MNNQKDDVVDKIMTVLLVSTVGLTFFVLLSSIVLSSHGKANPVSVPEDAIFAPPDVNQLNSQKNNPATNDSSEVPNVAN
jgi:hypothetical protein